MLELDKNALPNPGRGLDAWIAEHVLGWKRIHGVLVPPWLIRTIERRLKQIAADGYDMCATRSPVPDCPEVSTTHAFFQVMEAKKQWNWEFYHYNVDLICRLWTEGVKVGIYWADYPDREAAYAYVVCCCVYLAMGGEK